MVAVTHDDIVNTTLVKRPFKTIGLFFFIMIEGLVWTAKQAIEHSVAVLSVLLACAGAACLFVFTPAQYIPARDAAAASAEFASYWVLLGVLSSVGLGSGLHTFLLYLGPHIIRVTNHAVQCGNTHFTAEQSVYWSPTPQYAADAWDCPKHFDAAGNVPGVSVLSILAKVAPAAFLWGLGTALGELPPYFAARAAAASGKRLEELREVQDSEARVEGDKAVGVMDWAKVVVYEGIQRYGFFAVAAAASIPNPLFDLAGMTCGHFGVPFWTFFGATLVGKACVKVMIQVLFYATVFNPASLAALRTGVTAAIQAVEDGVFGYQYKSCWNPLPASYAVGEAAAAALAEGGVLIPDAPTAPTALPKAALQACAACCKSTFAGAGLAVERCGEGCTSFVHGPGVVPLVWQGMVAAAIGWFLLTFLQSTVQDYLTQQTIAAATAPGTPPATKAPRARSAARKHRASPAVDRTFKPQAGEVEDDGEGGVVAAPIGRTVATRTRGSRRHS